VQKYKTWIYLGPYISKLNNIEGYMFIYTLSDCVDIFAIAFVSIWAIGWVILRNYKMLRCKHDKGVFYNSCYKHCRECDKRLD
jgi:hypothetical protein